MFGCGGDRDSLKRPIMTKIVYEMSDIIIPTADNSRSEDIEKIFEDMKKAYLMKLRKNFILLLIEVRLLKSL